MIVEPYLGVNPNPDNNNHTTAWSNPLVTKVLHNSHVEQLTARCPEQFRREYVELERPPDSSIARGLGIAAHAVVSKVLTDGNEYEKEKAQVTEFSKWIAPAIGTERPEELYKQLSRSINVALDWIKTNIGLDTPQSEKPFVVERASDIVPGVSEEWKLAGTMDLFIPTNSGDGYIIDLKFRDRSKGEEGKSSSQPGFYGLGVAYHGFNPKFLFLEVIKGTKAVETEVEIDAGRLNFTGERIQSAIRMMESGVYPLNTGSWWCSQKYCKHWSNCRGKYEK